MIDIVNITGCWIDQKIFGKRDGDPSSCWYGQPNELSETP